MQPSIPLTRTIKRKKLADILAQVETLDGMMAGIREAMLAPTAKKTAPMLSAVELAALVGLDRNQLDWKRRQGEAPDAPLVGNKRLWPLEVALPYIRRERQPRLKPAGGKGVVVTVANFKGGVSKTTTAVALCQGLALRGHRVLLIDLDPQGSATTLFGALPDVDVEEERTAVPLFNGETDTILSAAGPTYWPGIDLVQASPALYGLEFSLPARQQREKGFEFWAALHHGLEEATDAYDVIIIDTPPSLGYTTINALLAADGLLIPLPPGTLDFASSCQFWRLYGEMASTLPGPLGADKEFEFIDIMLSRVEASDSATPVVKRWIFDAYGEMVAPVEIPKTAVTSAASAEFGTVYDMAKGTIDSRTYDRARTAYDSMVDYVESQLVAVWTLRSGNAEPKQQEIF